MNKQSNHIDFLEFPGNSAETITKVKAFYSSAFGWSFKDWSKDYIDTSSSGLSCGFAADPGYSPKPLAVIYTSDLLAARAAVLAAGGALTKEAFEFPGGKRFQFTDPAGNELGVWSEK